MITNQIKLNTDSDMASKLKQLKFRPGTYICYLLSDKPLRKAAERLASLARFQ